MLARPNPPIFCDNCSSFALADLEGVYLCAGCLMSALMSSTDPELFEHIIPLESAETSTTATPAIENTL